MHTNAAPHALPAGHVPLSESRSELSARQFAWIAATVFDYCGIHLPPAKHQSVEGRLAPRVRALGLRNLRAYVDLLSTEEGRKREFVHFIDAITINKTEFFRESGHYRVLVEKVLPYLAGSQAPLRLWSAGCSSGEEAYTLAMVLREYGETHPSCRFSVLATDISQRMLERGVRGVYSLEAFAAVPQALRRKYLMRNRDPGREDGRVAPEIRALVEFQRLNLMDRSLAPGGPFDVIFCRNVMIYFTQEGREALIGRLLAQLRIGGHLFVGHSETVNTNVFPVVTVAPTVFRRTE